MSYPRGVSPQDREEEQYLFTKSEVMDLVRQVIKDELIVETDYLYDMGGSPRIEITLKIGGEVISEDSFRVDG